MNPIDIIKKALSRPFSNKNRIVKRLLEEKHITVSEATILLKDKVKVNVSFDHLTMSSGARIIVGDENQNEL